MNDGLQNLDAEAAVLAFLLSWDHKVDEKISIIQVLISEHFSFLPYCDIFNAIKQYDIYDHIVLWEKMKENKGTFSNAEVGDIATLPFSTATQYLVI